MIAPLVGLAFFTGSLFAGFDPDLELYDSGIVQIDLSQIVGGQSSDHGDIAWAVYAPGKYSEDIADDYVYAYQLFNNSGEIVIGTFKVGVVTDAGIDVVDFSSSPEGSDVDPALYVSMPQEVFYLFDGDGIVEGQHSSLLLFTSPYAPTDGFATVTLGASGSLDVSVPTPVPEPVTILLLAAGLVGLRSRRS